MARRTMALMLLGCAFATGAMADAEADLAALVRGQPRDIADFSRRRALCTHWAGEDPYDAERARHIERAQAALACARVDEDEQNLRGQYKDAPATLKVLDAIRDRWW